MGGKTKLVIFAIAVSILTVLVSSQVIDLTPYMNGQATDETNTEIVSKEGIYIVIEAGDKPIPGPERDDRIECLSFEDSVTSPRDAASGLPTGKRQYEPIKITKRIDKASPLMHKVISNNENLDIKVSFYKTINNEAVEFYTITLEDAKLVGIKTSPVKMPNGKTEIHEEYSFVFGKIEWVYVDGGISHIDDWEAPAV